MKNKLLIMGGVLLATTLILSPVVSNAMYYDGGTESNQEVEQESNEQDIEELEKLKEEMKDLTSSEDYDEKEYRELSEDITEQEIKSGTYDYRGEVELRVNSVKTAIQDMKRDLKNGVPEKFVQDINNRIKKLTPVVDKYDAILKKEDVEKIDFEKIATQLNKDLDAVYEKIN